MNNKGVFKIPSERKTFWAWTVASFFGVGFGKPGPGTWGSVAAVLLWALAGRVLHPSAAGLNWMLVAGVLLTLALGVPAGSTVERESRREDPGFVVVDEVCGQWIALLCAPFSLLHGVMALILFRIFDMTKPWPIRNFERIRGGWGIMLDDVAAGVLALVVASILRLWI